MLIGGDSNSNDCGLDAYMSSMTMSSMTMSAMLDPRTNQSFPGCMENFSVMWLILQTKIVS